MPGRLLVGICHPQQQRFTEWPAEYFEPDRHSIGREACGHGERWKPGGGTEPSIAAEPVRIFGLRIRENIVRDGRRLMVEGRIRNGIEPMFGHDLHDSMS